MLLIILACTDNANESGVVDLNESSLSPTERSTLNHMAMPYPQVTDPTNRWVGNDAAESLGELLFFEPKLSRDQDISCASCHDPSLGFTDGLPQSLGIATTLNSAPSLYGTGIQRWLNWDGSCDTTWCQAIGPIEKENEMGSSRVALVQLLTAEPTLREPYEELFGALPSSGSWPETGQPGTAEWERMSASAQQEATTVLVNVAKALGAYEATLLPPSAPIDYFLDTYNEDEESALELLTEEQTKGLKLFIGEGECFFCHTGRLFTNFEFHNIGLPLREWMDADDIGRYQGIERLRLNPFNAAGEWSDAPDGEKGERVDRLNQTTDQLGQYKTPHLRELNKSAPYMHGGHFETLREVVQHYADPQGEPLHGHREELIQVKEWEDEEIEAIISFLELFSAEDGHDN